MGDVILSLMQTLRFFWSATAGCNLFLNGGCKLFLKADDNECPQCGNVISSRMQTAMGSVISS